MYDFSEIEHWKDQYPKDYKYFQSDLDEIVKATRLNQALWLNRSWDILNYIFTGESSEKDLPFLINETGDILQINLFWGGHVLLAENGEICTNYLEVKEVQDIEAALSRITEAKIWQRFEQGLIKRPEIYHFSWKKQNYEWLLGLCRKIQKFYQDAANQKNAILINID